MTKLDNPHRLCIVAAKEVIAERDEARQLAATMAEALRVQHEAEDQVPGYPCTADNCMAVAALTLYDKAKVPQ